MPLLLVSDSQSLSTHDAWIIAVYTPTPTPRPRHLELNYSVDSMPSPIAQSCSEIAFFAFCAPQDFPRKNKYCGRIITFSHDLLEIISRPKYNKFSGSGVQSMTSPFKGILSNFSRRLQQVGDEQERGRPKGIRYHRTASGISISGCGHVGVIGLK